MNVLQTAKYICERKYMFDLLAYLCTSLTVYGFVRKIIANIIVIRYIVYNIIINTDK